MQFILKRSFLSIFRNSLYTDKIWEHLKCSLQSLCIFYLYIKYFTSLLMISGPRQANLVLIAYASSEGSGETARMRRLAWTFAARIGDKWKIRLARPI